MDTNKLRKFKVRLRSNEESAAAATDRTLGALPLIMSAALERDENNKIKFDAEGNATVICFGKEDWIRRAIIQQGYVAAIVE